LHVHTGTRTEQTTAQSLAKAVSELRRSDVAFPVAETLGIPQLRAGQEMPEAKVLVLYTGGTIGMKSVDGVYVPVAHYLPEAVRELPPLNDKAYVEAHYAGAAIKPLCLPPVRHMHKRVLYWVCALPIKYPRLMEGVGKLVFRAVVILIVEYHPLLDSSDMTFDDWIRIARDISASYDMFDGFVVLHGTDTMAYTSSVLSFMLENLRKPVVVTGAQIPICEVRSDGRDNFIGSLIIAGELIIPEVTLYFDNKLLRGNRAIKYDNFGLNAFISPNMQPLAHMEIDIKGDIQKNSLQLINPFSQFNFFRNVCVK
uniref:Putative l-asparaginase I (inferred by orthology to a S. mansoni protein) n=1 Tax=Anisakis simplex TaxID=6269 RepID=A0A0M3KCS6_ANISI